LLSSVTNGVECRQFVDDGTPYIRVGDMHGLRIASDSAARISAEAAGRLRDKIGLAEGDVLVARSGSIGQAALVTQANLHSILSSHLIRLRTQAGSPVTSEFLALFLASMPGVQQVLRNANGAIVPEISQQNLKAVVIPLLSRDTQHVLGGFVHQSWQAEDESRDLLLDAVRTTERAATAKA
jgi:type I restriction enzyme M protein